MNRLQYETSPYLLQHAHNPVDWHPWGKDALDKSRREDKLILVSIGYSTCHWCHVMERESFEDPDVAAFMNAHFVNIKVDREERPDVDQLFMEVCQIINGNGGWPLNCFLLPDGRPFFAGTYYPPRPMHNRPSWMQVLHRLYHAFIHRRAEVEAQAEQILSILKGAQERFAPTLQTTPEAAPSPEDLEPVFQGLRRGFDTTYGGFGGAPKFPSTMALDFLLRYGWWTKNEEALGHVFFSLEKMIRGGIYDQLGGGFARYATDAAWLVPHFEKMLYDNALLVSLLAEAHKMRPSPLLEQAIRQTLEFIQREMSSPEGAFFSALDADSEGEEGKFYVWSYDELLEALGEERSWVAEWWGASPEGNWEGKNILHRPHEPEAFARAQGLSLHAMQHQLEEARGRLLQVRARRIRPGLDDKTLLDWNALQCSAYAKAFEALQEASYLEAARKNLGFLQTNLRRPDGGLYHTWKAGKAKIPAFLDDYAFLVQALLDVFEADQSLHWLEEARHWTTYVLEHFHDPAEPLFFFTEQNAVELPVRKKELYDNATPSGNAVMARNLRRLGIVFGEEEWVELSESMIARLRENIRKYPQAFGYWATAWLETLRPPFEIAVIGKQAPQLGRQVLGVYLPGRVLQTAPKPNPAFPLLNRGELPTDETWIFLCQNYSCRQPVKTMAELMQLIELERS